MDARQINKGISAHGVWKVRLHEAISSGKSDFSPETVILDNVCEFGKWFYSIPVNDRPADFWPRIKELHARFHEEAGKILKLALDGKSAEALAIMTDLRGVFVSTSTELTNTLYAWKKVSL